MSKSTKIIAALGVVAGLGVAALPLSSYAAEGDGTISGSVTIGANITSSIAMRIQSAADDYTYTVVAEPGENNPSEKGWYVENGGVYTLSEDTSVQSGTTYYTRSSGQYGFIGYSPAASLSSSDDAAVAGPSNAGVLQLAAFQADTTSLYSDIQVRSNTGSFSLTLKDADDNTNLNLATPSNAAGEFIPTDAVEPVANAAASWGVISETGATATEEGRTTGEISTWSAMPASNAAQPLTVLANGSNGAGAYSTATRVYYGVTAGSTKVGTYTDTVQYTATAINGNQLTQ